MSEHLTVKQEAFAQAMATIEFDDDKKNVTAYQREAFKIAYDTTNWKETSIDCEASKYMAIPKISQRVKELRDFGTKYSKTAIANRLDRIATTAEQDKQLAVASSTVQALGKLSGHFIDKTENKHNHSGSVGLDVNITFKGV